MSDILPAPQPDVDDLKVCPRCRTTKPLSDFWQRDNAKDGRQTYCKECLHRMSQRARRRHDHDPVAARTCPDCQQHLPADQFYRNRRRPDGLSYRCKGCKLERRRQRRRQDA